MIYQYTVRHSHGMAAGSIEASSKSEAEGKVAKLYDNKPFSTQDSEAQKDGTIKTGNPRVETTKIENIELREAV